MLAKTGRWFAQRALATLLWTLDHFNLWGWLMEKLLKGLWGQVKGKSGVTKLAAGAIGYNLAGLVEAPVTGSLLQEGAKLVNPALGTPQPFADPNLQDMSDGIGELAQALMVEFVVSDAPLVAEIMVAAGDRLATR